MVGPVLPLEDLHVLERADCRADLFLVGLAAAVDDQIVLEVRVLTTNPSRPVMLPPTSPMATATRPRVPGLLIIRNRIRTE